MCTILLQSLEALESCAHHLLSLFPDLQRPPTEFPHTDTRARLQRLAATARSLDGVQGMSEAGIAAFDFPSWSGIGVPARTPKNVVDTLNAAFNAVSNDADSKAHFAKLSQYTLAGPPEDFGRVLVNETEVWSKLIQSLNMKFE